MDFPEFIYTKGNIPCEGVFAFTFYSRGWLPKEYVNLDSLGRDLYIKGLQMYLDVITTKDSPFSNWKILLYTDEATYNLALSYEYPLFLAEKIEFVVVKWPYYTKPETPTQVNDDILRIMRFRAFFDFSTVPVFVRDADTIFAVNEYGTLRKSLTAFSDDVLQWETNYLNGAKNYPNTFIFGTSIGYKSFWHKNARTGAEAPVGAFAGLQSTMPIVPCFQDESLWVQSMEYIRAISIRKEVNTNVRFSNEDSSIQIGKDEQILLFILRAACHENIFYFDLDIGFKRRYTTKMRKYFDVEYPTILFKRGSNTTLEKLFTINSKNTNALKQSALNNEKQLEESTRRKIQEEMKDILERINKYGNIYEYLNKLSLKNSSINKLIASCMGKIHSISQLKTRIENKYLYNEPTDELKEKIISELDERDALVEKIKSIASTLQKQTAGTRKRKASKKRHLKTRHRR